ncbi:MAG: ArsR family transcriptional regulator [Saprospiraceae bacterium]
MIEILISSKTRIKLLMKFFLNSNATAYLRSLESEFGESSNAIRLELNRFEEAGMLVSRLDGNKKIFQANTEHPLFKEVHNILLKQIGLDRVIENVIERLGEVSKVYVIGEFSKGLDSQVIDLVFIGNIEINYLVHLIEKVETLIKRKIRYLIYSEEEFENLKSWGLTKPKPLLLWAKD